MKTVSRITVLMLVISLFMSVCAFASPDVLPLDVSGNAGGILTVTNPASANVSTYDKQHNISGYAAAGATVTIYSAMSGRYCAIRRTTVGASGVFVQPVTLSKGRNDLLIRADINGHVQYVKRTVNVLSMNFFNLLKGFSMN